MVLREDDHGIIAIGQASHAWLSGQLARAWGSPRFGSLHPHEAVCLAAEQHDVGMAAWDLHPTYNPETGRPHSFTEMPLGTHLELWTAGPRRLITQSRYAALLVSMHGRRLYELRDLETMTHQDAAAVRTFIADQNDLQRELRQTLCADPATAASSTPELIARNSDLLWTWDYLSLALCLNWAPCEAKAVPTIDRSTDVKLRPAGRGALSVEPWPFEPPAPFTVSCEGRRLTQPAANPDELQAALAAAPWETVEFELTPAKTT
jgi:hypothetical protein